MAYNAKILLIEDDELSQIITRELLESLGCVVDVGGTGAEGIRLYEQHVYDLVLVDLRIFDMDGFKIAKEIKKIQKTSKNKTPLMVLSNHSEESVKKLAKKSGFKEFLAKPLTVDMCKIILRDFSVKELKDSSSTDFLRDNSEKE